MIGIVVDHDVVAPPIPVAAKSKVEVGHHEVEPMEPEAMRASTLQAPNVAAPNATPEVPVLPGVIEVVVCVIVAGVVANPLAIRMDMGSVWVPWLIAEIAVGRGRVRLFNARRTMGRNKPAMLRSPLLLW